MSKKQKIIDMAIALIENAMFHDESKCDCDHQYYNSLPDMFYVEPEEMENLVKAIQDAGYKVDAYWMKKE